MRFLFWNTHKNQEIDKYIAAIVVENKIDFICLAEYSGKADNLCHLLENQNKFKLLDSPGCERITIIGEAGVITPGFHDNYSSFQVLKNRVLLCMVHLPSKIYCDEETRELVASNLVYEIEKFESSHKGISTIVFGDFNDNPYKKLCLCAGYFHGIPNSTDSKRIKRTIFNKEYKMFYNPMWNHYGNESFPPGTYYYNSGEAECTYWNMYDQVIIRPDLIECFKDSELRILCKAGEYELIDSNNHPNKSISDHLPIIFELEV